MFEKLTTFFIISFYGLVMAQDVPPIDVTPVPPVVSFVDRITGILGGITTIVTTHPYVSLGATILIEVLGRLLPSKKPLGVISGVGRILGACGTLFMALDGVISKVIPQNIKPVQ